tara:strand:- start:3509 stop:4480 length:972 start_codon:yes stop_codon:yes gene_type:complete
MSLYIKKPIIYNLDDYYKLKEIIIPYTLPPSTLKIIDYVSNLVGSPNYVKTPQFLNSNDGDKKKKKKFKPNEINNEDWEAIRNFQATTLNEKTGIHKTIDTLKSEIMKVTDKNFNEQQSIILEIIRENILVWDETQLNDVGKIILEISSSNIFFSKVYSAIIVEIIKSYDFIIPLISNFKKEFANTIENLTIENDDSFDDYESLCKRNKANERIRSNALFFVNIMLHEQLENNYILNIITSLQNKLLLNVEDSTKCCLNEEISEILFVILESSHELLNQELPTEFASIKRVVQDFSSMKSNNKGISNKIIFKFMDLFDIINNT